MPEGADGALELGGEGNVRDNALSLDELTGLDDLLVTLGGERNVNPTGELVLKVPGRLPMTNEDKGVLVAGREETVEGREGSNERLRRVGGGGGG